VDLTEAQGDVLQNGLEYLADWSDALGEHGLVAQRLPVAGQSLGAALDFGAALRWGLFEPIETYFAGDDTPTSAELVDVIKGLSATFGDLQITVDAASVQGGFDAGAAGDALVFDLVFQAARTVSSHVSLGPRGDAMGLAFAAGTTVDLDVSAAMDLRFGLDLAPDLESEDAFFIEVNAWDMSAEVAATSPLGGDKRRSSAASKTSEPAVICAS